MVALHCASLFYIYQSSSSSLLPCIDICLALKASAKPRQARRPPITLPITIRGIPSTTSTTRAHTHCTISWCKRWHRFSTCTRSFRGSRGCGFAFAAAGRVPLMPFADGGGAGTARIAGAGGVGGAGGAVGLGASSMRYAEGAHPWEEPSSFLASHQPGIEISRLYG